LQWLPAGKQINSPGKTRTGQCSQAQITRIQSDITSTGQDLDTGLCILLSGIISLVNDSAAPADMHQVIFPGRAGYP